MQIDPQVRFLGMAPSEAIESVIRERIARMERFHERITSCSVIVEAPHRHSHKGKIFHVRIDVTAPGTELVVSKEPEHNHAHEDVYVAIRDSFNALERRLEDHVRRSSGHGEKAHRDVASSR